MRAAVPVLLDPDHPTTVFTVHDVDSNDNAGLVSFISLFGACMTLGGLAYLFFIARVGLRSRRRSRRHDAELAELRAR